MKMKWMVIVFVVMLLVSLVVIYSLSRGKSDTPAKMSSAADQDVQAYLQGSKRTGARPGIKPNGLK